MANMHSDFILKDLFITSDLIKGKESSDMYDLKTKACDIVASSDLFLASNCSTRSLWALFESKL